MGWVDIKSIQLLVSHQQKILLNHKLVVPTFSLFIWVFIKAITTRLFLILRKCLYCEHNTSTVANKLSSVLILDLHAVKDKRTVKYIPLKEGKWRSKLLLHCYRLRDFYFLIYAFIFNPYKNMHRVPSINIYQQQLTLFSGQNTKRSTPVTYNYRCFHSPTLKKPHSYSLQKGLTNAAVANTSFRIIFTAQIPKCKVKTKPR